MDLQQQAEADAGVESHAPVYTLLCACFVYRFVICRGSSPYNSCLRCVDLSVVCCEATNLFVEMNGTGVPVTLWDRNPLAWKMGGDVDKQLLVDPWVSFSGVEPV